MTAGDPLPRLLDDLGCAIAGRPPGPAPPDSPEPAVRRRLLLGAAVLTGRGDLAQEALHRASARAVDDGGPRAVERAVLRAVRELRLDTAD